MLHSIQEILKIINNRLSRDLLWVFTSFCLMFTGYLLGLSENYYKNIPSVSLIKTEENQRIEQEQEGIKVIFGSSKGKYYYYRGCGGDTISAKNLVYYKSESEAEKMGKKLYKSCE